MKNEELFDLITELKVDDRFIEEAISDDLDERSPIKAYAGNTKRSPMRIIALAAACLAVIAGAGIVFANVNGAKKAPVTPADTSASASGGVSPAVSGEDFIEQCKNIVAGENPLLAQSEMTWQTSRLDVDFDGEDEYLVYPQTDGKTVKDIGVRVFKKVNGGDIRDLGAFGKDSDCIDLNKIRKDERDGSDNQYYYCFSHDDEDGLYDGIRFVSYNEEENTVSDEKHLMRVTDHRTNNYLTEGSYENDEYIGSEQSFIVRIRDFPDDITETFCEFTKAEIAKCENDALTRNGKLELEELLTPGMWHSGEYDINGDGETELLISLFNFSNMRGVFVYNKNCEYLGSFETENGLCDPELLNLYDRDGEKYWYYLGVEGPTIRDGYRYTTWIERVSLNKINVENNSFSTERLIHYDVIWDSDDYHTHTKNHCVYWIGDKEVTEAEFRKAEHFYHTVGMGSHGFDLTDPIEWKYTMYFEDSELTGSYKEWSGRRDILNNLKPTD